jgi:hypothetical protein
MSAAAEPEALVRGVRLAGLCSPGHAVVGALGRQPCADRLGRCPITSSAHLNGRSGPKTSNRIVKIYGPGTTVSVVCQTKGSAVGTTSVWNKLDDGNYVSDYYVSTPSKTTYSAAAALHVSVPDHYDDTEQTDCLAPATPNPAASPAGHAAG